MSEDIYRISCSGQTGIGVTQHTHDEFCFVPVERCEHGRLDGHWWGHERDEHGEILRSQFCLGSPDLHPPGGYR